MAFFNNSETFLKINIYEAMEIAPIATKGTPAGTSQASLKNAPGIRLLQVTWGVDETPLASPRPLASPAQGPGPVAASLSPHSQGPEQRELNQAGGVAGEHLLLAVRGGWKPSASLWGGENFVFYTFSMGCMNVARRTGKSSRDENKRYRRLSGIPAAFANVRNPVREPGRHVPAELEVGSGDAGKRQAEDSSVETAEDERHLSP